MQKIFLIFLILTALLVFIFGMEAADLTSLEPWIRHNTTEILILHDEYLPDEEIITHFRNIQEQFGVYLVRVMWRNMGRSISIYTTDTTLDGGVSLISGTFPIQLSDGFISNKQTSDPAQSGRFHYFTTQDREITIVPIDALNQTGLGGIFFLNTTDREVVDDITAYLEESLIASVQVRNTYTLSRSQVFMSAAMMNLPLAALLMIMCILFAFIVIRYILLQSKYNALMAVEGYSKKRVTFEYTLGALPIFMFSFLFISACILIILIINSNINFWWIFIRDNIIFHSSVLALFVLSVFCLTSFQTARNKTVKIISGNKPSFALTIMLFLSKYVVLIVIVIASVQFQSQLAYLREQQQADINWQQSRDVYRTAMRVSSDLGSLISRRPVEIRGKQLFRELSEELGLFLICTHNFQQMDDGRYFWELNTDLIGIHSLNGRTITINENYLHRHPVYAVDGSPAKENLVYDPFVQNILVPISLSSHEADIYQSFLQSFYFTKVLAANIYNSELGLPLDDTKIEQLSINIIFVENGNDYFTYNRRTAFTTHNIITDPIVVIDTFNLDANYYDAWLTSAAFFESHNPNPFDDLSPIVARNNMRTALGHVVSVFDVHAESMRETEENLRVLMLVGIALLSAFVFSIYAFIASYYEQHKYAIYIKRIFGYSYSRCNWHILVFGTGLTVLILLSSPVAWYVIVAVAVVEVLLIMLFSNAIGNKSFSEIIKGVH